MTRNVKRVAVVAGVAGLTWWAYSCWKKYQQKTATETVTAAVNDVTNSLGGLAI